MDIRLETNLFHERLAWVKLGVPAALGSYARVFVVVEQGQLFAASSDHYILYRAHLASVAVDDSCAWVVNRNVLDVWLSMSENQKESCVLTVGNERLTLATPLGEFSTKAVSARLAWEPYRAITERWVDAEKRYSASLLRAYVNQAKRAKTSALKFFDDPALFVNASYVAQPLPKKQDVTVGVVSGGRAGKFDAGDRCWWVAALEAPERGWGDGDYVNCV